MVSNRKRFFRIHCFEINYRENFFINDIYDSEICFQSQVVRTLFSNNFSSSNTYDLRFNIMENIIYLIHARLYTNRFLDTDTPITNYTGLCIKKKATTFSVRFMRFNIKNCLRNSWKKTGFFCFLVEVNYWFSEMKIYIHSVGSTTHTPANCRAMDNWYHN